jgi:DNA modification methylase
MTDPEFRRFVGAPDGPQWLCRRTVVWAKSLVRVEDQTAEGNAMPEPTLDRPSRNYEFLFLFTKQPNYYFDRTAIDVRARSSRQSGIKANAGSVWETTHLLAADEDAVPDGLWRVNSEASPYRHIAMWPRALVRQMLLPTTREGDIVLDPFAGSGTTGEVALKMGRKAVLIESSQVCIEAMQHRIGRLAAPLL